MPDDKTSHVDLVARMKRMYGEDFYELPHALQQVRVQTLDRQYAKSTVFLDDLRLDDWRRLYEKAFGGH